MKYYLLESIKLFSSNEVHVVDNIFNKFPGIIKSVNSDEFIKDYGVN